MDGVITTSGLSPAPSPPHPHPHTPKISPPHPRSSSCPSPARQAPALSIYPTLSSTDAALSL